MARAFNMLTGFRPRGDQPQAIEALIKGVEKNVAHQVLLGVTGSGKTFTMANVIARLGRPALIIAPNKTLAAQLYGEFKELFPGNAVEYFVSYYDYYQPEAYIPSTDTYIEKDSAINEAIDRMRHSATYSLWTRRDVIIVASVSCIYGLGSPREYRELMVELKVEQRLDREQLLKDLVGIYYQRNDYDFQRGSFRVRGDVVEIFPVYEEKKAIRVEFMGDQIEAISEIDPLLGKKLRGLDRIDVYPGSHYVTSPVNMERALKDIEAELDQRLAVLRARAKLLEAQRLEQRTRYDLEMIRQTGFCSGIENYSRHIDNRRVGVPPATLLDYFPPDWLLFIDESHIAVPQIGGMYRGDRSRKLTLVDFGFRLPSALDNRPLNFREFEERVNQVIYVSATPAEYELKISRGRVAEQVVRPTGLMDPPIEVRPAADQVDDLLQECRKVTAAGRRVLVTTLTKRMAEDLSEHYQKTGLKVKYLHSDIDTIARSEIILDLRRGEFDVLIGINLLREGLDLPEVELVAILDADREGFLRSERSLIQTCGRASRNLQGRVIMYAASRTDSMERAIAETERRRRKQAEYNREHGITPAGIEKNIGTPWASLYEADYTTVPLAAEGVPRLPRDKIQSEIERLKKRMLKLSRELQFEKAAKLRDEIRRLEKDALSW